MRAHRGNGAALAAVGLVLLALVACTTDPPSTSRSPVEKTPRVGPDTASPATAATSGYAGSSPMPAADGGPMLWAFTLDQTTYDPEFGGPIQVQRAIFVDANGNLVARLRYSGYEYCRDASGRATLLLAFGPGEVHVLDLHGALVTRVTASWARCAGDTHAVFEMDSDPHATTFNHGLFNLRTGTVVLPIKVGRQIFPLNAETVNVREGDEEYLFDLATEEKTPHAGHIEHPDYPSDPPWPAAADGSNQLFGYLDRAGEWALEPRLTGAGSFREGHAIVGDDSTSYFVDSHLKQVGEQWDTAEAFGEFYRVTKEAEGVTRILDSDLRTVLELSPDQLLHCESSGEEGACLIVSGVDPPRLVRLPEGTVTELPEGFTRLLSRTLVGDDIDNPDTGEYGAYTSRVYDAITGTTFSLATPGECEAVGEDWLNCSDGIYTASGQRTAFRQIRLIHGATTPRRPTASRNTGSVPESTTAPYYWATSGAHRGFVDASGRWLYRESRYLDLED